MPQFNLKFSLPYGERFVQMTVTASSYQDADLFGDAIAEQMPPQRIPYTDDQEYQWTCITTEVTV